MPRLRFPRSRPARLVAALLGATLLRAAESPIEVTAKLATPHEVLVTWHDPVPSPAGHVVEFINHPTDTWVILGFIPAAQNTYRHPRLAPGTPYSYRIRAFYGPTTPEVKVTVAEGLSNEAYAEAYARPEDYGWAPPRRIAVPGQQVRKMASVRMPGTEAAPVDFKAELMKATVSGFRFTWADAARDEDGFLLERVTGPNDFTVCAVVEPDINSFGWALEPPQRTGTFRLRAYYFGEASPVAAVMTGPAEDEPIPGAKPVAVHP